MRKSLVEPFHKKRAVIVWQPAFQAGCRGFEPRLPLPWHNKSLCRLSTSRLKASRRRYGKQGDRFVFGENVHSDHLPRFRATTCLASRDHLPCRGRDHLPSPARDHLPPVSPPACFPLQQGGTRIDVITRTKRPLFIEPPIREGEYQAETPSPRCHRGPISCTAHQTGYAGTGAPATGRSKSGCWAAKRKDDAGIRAGQAAGGGHDRPRH